MSLLLLGSAPPHPPQNGAVGAPSGISLPPEHPNSSLALSSLQTFKEMGVSVTGLCHQPPTAGTPPCCVCPPLLCVSPPSSVTLLSLPRCWRRCGPPPAPCSTSPSRSAPPPTGANWKPSSNSSPRRRRRRGARKPASRYRRRLRDLLNLGGAEGSRFWGEIRHLRRHTTLLQMAPSSSISHRTSSPRCEGQGDAGSPRPPPPWGPLCPPWGPLCPLWGPLRPHSAPPNPILSPFPPFPHLKKHGGLPKYPHAGRSPRQQDVPGDQRDEPGQGGYGRRHPWSPGHRGSGVTLPCPTCVPPLLSPAPTGRPRR